MYTVRCGPTRSKLLSFFLTESHVTYLQHVPYLTPNKLQKTQVSWEKTWTC